jgi:hypothetical protein
MAKPSAPTTRGCPDHCTQPTIGLQRPITDEEFEQISPVARAEVFKSIGRCYVCRECALVYIRQPATDVLLGRLVYSETGTRRTFETYLRQD